MLRDTLCKNSTQSNKLNSYLAVKAVLDGTEVWQSLPAFATGAEYLEEHIATLQSIAQTQTSQSGAAAEKAFQVLVDAAFEVADATENVGSLADYGVPRARLTALKKKIENFQAVQAKPRQGRATSSSATKKLAKLFREVDELLSERLDALAVQFQVSQAAFFNAYNTARSVVSVPRWSLVEARDGDAAALVSKAA